MLVNFIAFTIAIVFGVGLLLLGVWFNRYSNRRIERMVAHAKLDARRDAGGSDGS